MAKEHEYCARCGEKLSSEEIEKGTGICDKCEEFYNKN